MMFYPLLMLGLLGVVLLIVALSAAVLVKLGYLPAGFLKRKHQFIPGKRSPFASIFSPPQIAIHTRTVEFSMPMAELAVKVFDNWFPQNPAAILEGAPVRAYGELIKKFDFNSGMGKVILKLHFEAPAKRKASPREWREISLVCHFRELDKGSTEISYDWVAQETALMDRSSYDYQLLWYLVERAEVEFQKEGYKLLGAPPSKGMFAQRILTGRNASQWWRSYSPGSGASGISISWPSPQDYAEAVQNPAHNFKDDVLKNCKPVLNELGMPRVRSGMFASVYQLEDENQQWAVRCFDKRLSDQQERYQAISRFILEDHLPFTVDFHYIEDGIKCGDAWFPVLKMPWVEGESLESYLGKIYREPELLQKLRREFQLMMDQLRINGAAHGDLQHGNILVKDGEIYLVDYDGFFVPELSGKKSNELGHHNFQHPGRSENHFGPYLDNFAAWLIDFSLFCLIEDPQLWETFSGGDECLLFRRSDFIKPDSSALISALKHHRSEKIRDGVEILLDLLRKPLEEIPFFESDMSVAIELKEMQTQGDLTN